MAEATKLLTYLWENYIELNESTHVFLMGTNIGHAAITNFIKANEERAQALITKTIHFVVDVPMQTCRSQTDDALQAWYYATSLVFMSQDHNFWATDHARKPKKRFGRVFHSVDESISDMLEASKDAVTDMLLEQTAVWRANKATSDDEMDIAAEAPLKSPNRLPPIGNFAPSPKKTTNLAPSSAAASPRGRRARSPRLGSPPKMPALSNFAPTSRQRSSKSPAL